MGAGVVGCDVVAVVGGDERDVEVALESVERFADGFVGLEAVVLNLEEEVSFAEYLFEAACGALGLVVLAGH